MGRLASLVVLGLVNSIFARVERIQRGKEIAAERIKTHPLFVIGYPRSGTTYLQHLLSHDENFLCPTAYHCMFPSHFHYSKTQGSVIFDIIAPRKRPMDNMPFSASTPHEDEFALAALSAVSPYMRFLFPVTGDNGHSSLDPQALPREALQRWKDSLIHFLKSLSFWKDRKRIMLKSPPHTGRVRTLLELFPGAQFVHIVRNPYEVYLSNRKLWMNTLSRVHLQIPDEETVDEIILSWYTELFSLFERDRELIPAGSLHEMKFEDLEKAPMESLQNLYRNLSLPGFDRFWKRAAVYLETIEDYERDSHSPDRATRDKVGIRWRKTFDDYGYSLSWP